MTTGRTQNCRNIVILFGIISFYNVCRGVGRWVVLLVPPPKKHKSTAKQDGDRISKQFLCNIWRKGVMSAQSLEASLLGVETVLRLERDARSMVKLQATN